MLEKKARFIYSMAYALVQVYVLYNESKMDILPVWKYCIVADKSSEQKSLENEKKMKCSSE